MTCPPETRALITELRRMTGCAPKRLTRQLERVRLFQDEIPSATTINNWQKAACLPRWPLQNDGEDRRKSLGYCVIHVIPLSVPADKQGDDDDLELVMLWEPFFGPLFAKIGRTFNPVTNPGALASFVNESLRSLPQGLWQLLSEVRVPHPEGLDHWFCVERRFHDVLNLGSRKLDIVDLERSRDFNRIDCRSLAESKSALWTLISTTVNSYNSEVKNVRGRLSARGDLLSLPPEADGVFTPMGAGPFIVATARATPASRLAQAFLPRKMEAIGIASRQDIPSTKEFYREVRENLRHR